MAKTRRQLERQHQALLLARVDMQLAADTAAYLLGEHSEMEPGHDGGMPWRARRTLEAGLIVTYCRPFTHSNLHRLSPPSGLTDEYRVVHDGLMKLRNQVYAHTDDTGLRVIRAEALPETPDEVSLVEGWIPPSRDELTVLIQLATLVSLAFEIGAAAVLDQLAELPDASN